MATMKVVCIESFGGPEVLQLREMDMPQPQDDEVLVRVRAASVNPVDVNIRSGRYPPVKREQLPKILGRDISGTIERCGRAVTRFREGDDVFALLDGKHGGYAEYVALKAGLCAPKPRQLDHMLAAAVPLAALAAWQGLFDHGQLQPGQRVLIHGGAGGVGHFAIQLARNVGATVCTTVAADDMDFVRSLGAEEMIDYRADRFEDELHDVDLVFDLVAGDTQERSWSVLKDGGTLVSTVAKPSERKARELHARSLTYVTHPDVDELMEIGRLIDAGKVRPYVQASFPLDEARYAQDFLEHEHTQGKVVLEMTA